MRDYSYGPGGAYGTGGYTGYGGYAGGYRGASDAGVAADAGSAPAQDAGSANPTVEMQRFAYAPATLTVAAGTTVTFHNRDTVDHTLTSGPAGRPDGRFDHYLHPGASYSYTFASPGRYPYYCRIHWRMGMIGSVTVTSPTP